MKRFSLLIFFLTMVGALIYAGGATEEEQVATKEVIKLRWSQPEPIGHPWTDVGQMICDEINEKSNGRLDLVQYPAGALCNQMEGLDMLRMGSLDFMTSGPTVLTSFDERVNVFAIPYLFRNREHAYKAFESKAMQDLFNKTIIEKSDVRTIAVWYFGIRNVTTKGKPIYTPEDLKGVKIRCPDVPIWKHVIASLGANPVPVNYQELYMALQTGVAVGQDNPIPTIYAQKFYEVQDYINRTDHIVHMGSVHAAEKTWVKLSSEDRRLILDTFKKYNSVIDQKMDEDADEKLKIMMDHGIKVIDSDKNAFEAHATEYIMNVYGETLGDLIESIKAVK